MEERVVIVGAGPAGVLMAHYLLRRNDRYRVDIYERRGDPREVEFSRARVYPITLNDRGMNALGRIAGLESAVREISLEVDGTISHRGNGKIRVISRRKPFITLDRTRLAIALLDSLTKTFDNSRLNLHFNDRCVGVNLAEKTARFQKGLSAGEEIRDVPYDLLIGADGARSQVRTALLDTESFEFEQNYTPGDYKSIFLSGSRTGALQPGKIHSWQSAGGITVLLLYQREGTMGGVIVFPRENRRVRDLKSPEEVKAFFQECFPEIGQCMTLEEAKEFLDRAVGRVLTVRCSHYHYRDSVLLIGDAAHAVSPSLGQGCNAALEDVVLFDRLLDEFGDDRAAALAAFTERRKEDAFALRELSDHVLPTSPKRFLEFVLREQVAKKLHQLFPARFPPPLSDLLFESAIPYAEIARLYRGWIERMKRSNPTFSRF